MEDSGKILYAYSILLNIKAEFANYRFRQTPSVSTLSHKCSKFKYYIKNWQDLTYKGLTALAETALLQ